MTTAPNFTDLPLIGELRQRAQHGDPEARFTLGVCYAHGRGVDADPVLAYNYFRLASEQGHAGAQSSLGVCYSTGRGVGKADTAAARCFRKAAEQGHAVAQFNLGLAYIYGTGVAQDYLEAYVWFSLSASQGDPIAAESRDRAAEGLTFDQIQEGKVRFHQRHQQIFHKNH